MAVINSLRTFFLLDSLYDFQSVSMSLYLPSIIITFSLTSISIYEPFLIYLLHSFHTSYFPFYRIIIYYTYKDNLIIYRPTYMYCLYQKYQSYGTLPLYPLYLLSNMSNYMLISLFISKYMLLSIRNVEMLRSLNSKSLGGRYVDAVHRSYQKIT